MHSISLSPNLEWINTLFELLFLSSYLHRTLLNNKAVNAVFCFVFFFRHYAQGSYNQENTNFTIYHLVVNTWITRTILYFWERNGEIFFKYFFFFAHFCKFISFKTLTYFKTITKQLFVGFFKVWNTFVIDISEDLLTNTTKLVLNKWKLFTKNSSFQYFI